MCPESVLARVGLLMCLVVGSRQLTITEFDVPAAKESGESAELLCRYDRGGEAEDALIVKWWWTPLNAASEKAQLYQRIGSQPGVSMRHNIEPKDNDTIMLSATSPADSGLYECEVSLMSDKIEEVRQNQTLTVFTQGSGPNLTITEVADGPDADEEEDVLLECGAEDVAPMPDLDLTVNGENFNMSEYITGPDAEGLYAIVGNATLSKNSIDGYEVRCELVFADNNISHQPYVDVIIYDPSGALTTTPTETPEDATEPAAPASPDSLQNYSGDSSQSNVSFALLFALGLLTQVLLESSM